MSPSTRPLHAPLILLAIAIGILSMRCSAANPETILHNFASGGGGRLPNGALILVDGYLYGVTYYGGYRPPGDDRDRDGCVYRIAPDGSDYTVVHTFGDDENDARRPMGGLATDGTTLFGATEDGGPRDWGTIFKVGTDGGGYRVLHAFDGSGIAAAANPTGSLLLIDGALYGMATSGGSTGGGIIFKLTTDGSSFQILHSFGSVAQDGFFNRNGLSTSAISWLTRVGSTLYGTTPLGGSTAAFVGGNGILFAIQTDGSGYRILHHFGTARPDGGGPTGELASIGNTLFGVLTYGSSRKGGAIFRIGTDGSGFRVLRGFPADKNDGFRPQDGVVVRGSVLYGVTEAGGNSGWFQDGNFLVRGKGTVFKINPDGTGYEVIHHFGSIPFDGFQPIGPLTFMGPTLFGTTVGGDYGTVFKIALGSSFTQQAGTFQGYPDGGVGFITVKLTASGTFTGKAVLPQGTYSLSGKFAPDGNYSGSVSKPPIPINLRLDLSTITDSVRNTTLTGSIAGVSFSIPHAAYAAKQTVPEEGTHTVLLEATDPSVAIPQGAGYAALTVKKDGTATIAGKLSDDTSFSAGGSLVAADATHHRIAFYLTTLYSRKGLLTGAIDFDTTAGTCSGTLAWFRPPAPSASERTYKAGFGSFAAPIELRVTGGRYTKPDPGERILDLTANAPTVRLTFSAGGLAAATQNPDTTATLTTKNVALLPPAGIAQNPASVTLKVYPGSGLLDGTFKLTDPDPSKAGKFLTRSVTFKGALLSPQRQGAGYFLLPQRPNPGAVPPITATNSPKVSGKVELTPIP